MICELDNGCCRFNAVYSLESNTHWTGKFYTCEKCFTNWTSRGYYETHKQEYILTDINDL